MTDVEQNVPSQLQARFRGLPRRVLVGGSLVLVGLVAGLVSGATLAAPEGTTFYGCLNNFTGALLRVNTSGPSRCGWGEQGVQWGAQGPKGDSGATNVVVKTQAQTLHAGDEGDLTLYCPTGSVATGGGAWGTGVDNVQSYPASDGRWIAADNDVPTGWGASSGEATINFARLEVYVICAAP